MLFCKYTIECISNYIVFYMKQQTRSYWNKNDNSCNFFFITVNENLLYLSFQPLLQKIIVYPGKSRCLFLKQISNSLTLIFLYVPWIVMFLGFSNTKRSNDHKLLQPSSPLWLVPHMMTLKTTSSPLCSSKSHKYSNYDKAQYVLSSCYH